MLVSVLLLNAGDASNLAPFYEIFKGDNMNIKPKKLFNSAGSSECGIIGCDTDGVINFVNVKHRWAKAIWDKMLGNTWFPSEVSLIDDKVVFKDMTADDKKTYELVLAQLIVNDSVQTNQLMDSMNRYITDPIVNACIARQAYEEALHSQSYATLAEEVLPVELAEKVYELHKNQELIADYDEELYNKNQAVANMFKTLYKEGDPVTKDDLLVAFGANNVLEKLVFPAGFVTMWALGEKGLKGTASMISFIERDEDTHVALFKNIFRSTIREQYGDIANVPASTIEKIKNLISSMAETEIRWTKYLTKNLLGFSDRVIEQYIQYKANSVCDNLLLDKLYPETSDGGVLMNLENKWSMLKSERKTAFFEAKVGDYSTGSISLDF